MGSNGLMHTYHNCYNQVKQIPLILPKILEVIKPLESNLNGEGNHSEVVKEIEQHVEDRYYSGLPVGKLCK